MDVRVSVYVRVVVVMAVVMRSMGLCCGCEQTTEAKSQSGCGNQGQCNAFHNRDPFKTFKLEGEGWVVNRSTSIRHKRMGCANAVVK